MSLSVRGVSPSCEAEITPSEPDLVQASEGKRSAKELSRPRLPSRFFCLPMRISINGKSHTFEGRLNIEQVLEKLHIEPQQGVAVAHNRTVLLKSQFIETTIQEGDELEIIQATAGG